MHNIVKFLIIDCQNRNDYLKYLNYFVKSFEKSELDKDCISFHILNRLCSKRKRLRNIKLVLYSIQMLVDEKS